MARARGCGWSSIPSELLEVISGRLSGDADHVRLRQVCAHWRACTPPLAALRPWAVAGRRPDGPEPWRKAQPVGRFSMWLPRGRGDPVYVGAPHRLLYCYGAPRGWLALADYPRSPTRFVLWEPASRLEIPLPLLPGAVQVFLSADPAAPPEAGWMAIASQRRGEYAGGRLVYWRPGDSAWAELPSRHGLCVSYVYSAAFHRGRFYCTDNVGNLIGYDLKLGTASPPERVVDLNPHDALARSICDCCRCHTPRAVHLVTCNGDLLLVAIGSPQTPGRRHYRVSGVYRPALGVEAVELGQKVTDLGEYSLFLGRGDGFALSADEFPGIERNRVYFLEHDVQYLQEQWMAVFDVSSGAVEQIPYPEEFKDNGNNNWLPYTWFCPRKPFLDRVACALLFNGAKLSDYVELKNVLVEMGVYFQIQDDYLDCFGDPEVIGKVGTDIEDYKCSWLIVQAMELANENEMKILYGNYGKSDPECVAAVKNVYKELDLQFTIGRLSGIGCTTLALHARSGGPPSGPRATTTSTTKVNV
ncbi:hypothetical protein ACP4OV_025751 [Aristida adscensionis]